jgi:hypothetical protein
MQLVELENTLRAYRRAHGTVRMVRDTLNLLRLTLGADTANMHAGTVAHGEPAPYSLTRLSLQQSLTVGVEDANRVLSCESRLPTKGIL